MTGGQVKLSRVTGNAQIMEPALVSYPISTDSSRAVSLKTRGPGLYLSSSSDNILSMALLMKAGHDVLLKAGSPQDPEDGGSIYPADGDTVRLQFVNDVWRLPLATNCDSASSSQLEQLDTSFNRQVSVLPLELSATEQVQVYHNAWGHPSNSKLEHIVRFRRGKGFPRVRSYHSSKQVQEKKLPSTSKPPASPDTQEMDVTESELETPTSPAPSPPDINVGTEAHIDFSHGIKLGVHKEKYYLLFVLGSSDFTWASSTTTCKSPEGLLMSFLRHTPTKIKMLRVDCEFARHHGLGGGNSLFEAYCHSQ
eukprot:3272480-Rhodomonas_salina.1